MGREAAFHFSRTFFFFHTRTVPAGTCVGITEGIWLPATKKDEFAAYCFLAAGGFCFERVWSGQVLESANSRT